jgi:hypothetical protein
MPLILLFIGAILIVSALRDTAGQLGTALATDVPGFLVWGGAVAGVGALGFVPGMQRVAKPLIALVVLVLILRNYQAILAGFQHAIGQQQASVVTPSPAEAYAADPQQRVTPVQIAGGGPVEQTPATMLASALGTVPQAYLSAYGGSQSSGFGGTASTVNSGDTNV